VDGGANWTRLNAFQRSAISIRGSVVYVSNTGSNFSPIFERSTDSGLTFTRMSSTGARDITTSADGTVFIATATGVSKSTNGGVSFTPSGLVNINISKVRVAPDGTMYASSASNLYVSLNQGASWSFSQPSTKLTLGSDTVFRALNVASDNTVFAMIAGVVVKSVDRGNTWTAINAPLQGRQNLRSITQESGTPQNIYAISDAALAKSVDGGKNWQRSIPSTLCGTNFCYGTLVRQFNTPAATVFVVADLTDSRLSFSRDGGATFVKATFSPAIGAITSIVQSPTSKGILYASASNGVYRSIDAGTTWTRLATGLPVNSNHSAIAIDSINSNLIFTSVRTSDSTSVLYKSQDGGANWTLAALPLNSQVTSILAIADFTYVTSYGNGLFVSGDNGQSWTSQNSGTTTARFLKIAQSPTNPSNLFLTGDAGQVYQSLNAGTTWTVLNYRLPARDVADIIVDPDGKTLHLAIDRGSETSGYYQYTINPPVVGTLIDVYRLYSPVTEGYLYTNDENEYKVLTTAANWRGDGKVYRALTAPGSIDAVPTTPYYRLYSPVLRRHLWTTDLNEYTVLATRNWSQDGVAWHMSTKASDTSTPLFRLYSETGRKHFYTIDLDERNKFAREGWIDEGAVGYVLRPAPLP
jgi:photosystem II stability/assembly factor-like uncharacterized protein